MKIISKEEAVKKHKEAKELRELEVISEKEYDALVVKYKPIILREEDVKKENSSNTNNTPQTHNKKPIAVILWLIFFMPVGLYKMWNKKILDKNNKMDCYFSLCSCYIFFR